MWSHTIEALALVFLLQNDRLIGGVPCVNEVQQCVNEGNPDCTSSTDYSGSYSTTRSGHTCEAWSVNWASVGAHNYCRNPDSGTGPWCYTTTHNVEWEYCFRACDTFPCVNEVQQCVYEDNAECKKSTAYSGSHSTTRSGHTCEAWSVNWASVGAHNYCRNPDSGTGPWCYTTTHNVEWEYCFRACDMSDVTPTTPAPTTTTTTPSTTTTSPTTTTTTITTSTTTTTTTTTTHACMDITCQNDGSCVLINSTEYHCECQPQYFGRHCESYCNITWSEWSDCSKSCDYGMSMRKRLIFDESASSPCNVSIGVYEYRPCSMTQCRTYDRSDHTDCVARNGFFTNNACYFVAESSNTLYWNGIFDKCAAEGATVAHMYDATETIEAVMNFLMARHPHVTVWLALKGVSGSGASWMSSATTETALAMLNYAVPVTMMESCVALQVLQGETNLTERPEFAKMHHLPCDDASPSQPHVKHALCMKKTSFADFQTSKGKRIRMQDGSAPVSLVTESNWQCGLQCSRQEMCLGYNYRATTHECQLLKVKQRMPMQIIAGDALENIYTLEYNEEWNLYNRRY